MEKTAKQLQIITVNDASYLGVLDDSGEAVLIEHACSFEDELKRKDLSRWILKSNTNDLKTVKLKGPMNYGVEDLSREMGRELRTRLASMNEIKSYALQSLENELYSKEWK